LIPGAVADVLKECEQVLGRLTAVVDFEVASERCEIEA
jgi:hypothetical protein